MRLILIAAVGVAVWALLGEPKKTAANWLYPNKSAPWEHVVGFFYPNEHDPTEFIESPLLATVAACRDWAIEKTNEHGGAFDERSDYECGIGKSQQWNDLHTYRLIIK